MQEREFKGVMRSQAERMEAAEQQVRNAAGRLAKAATAEADLAKREAALHVATAELDARRLKLTNLEQEHKVCRQFLSLISNKMNLSWSTMVPKKTFINFTLLVS